jgi:hypothetical protein
MLTIREYLRSLSVYWWGPCCSLYFYSFLCCSIMCLYVLSSVLWCLLWFPHKNDVRFIFTSSYSNTFAHSDVQHILCCVLVLLFFVLCTLCCQFLWIIYFWSMILWLANGKHFLLFIRHPPWYSYVQSSPVIVLAVIEWSKSSSAWVFSHTRIWLIKCWRSMFLRWPRLLELFSLCSICFQFYRKITFIFDL